MTIEPKLIEIPGIPGKLREQSLDEFLSVLTPDHLARKQLDEIRNQALKSVELSTQLMQANEKVIELQNKLMAPVVQVPPNLEPQTIPKAITMVALGADKTPCPHCQKPVSTLPGPWAKHQARWHPDNPAPVPVV